MSDKKTEIKNDYKGYVELEHRFDDCFEKREVELKYHFCRPTRPQVARVQKSFSKDSMKAFSNFLTEIVHPDEKDAFLEDSRNYPGISATFANAILGSVGIGDLGN